MDNGNKYFAFISYNEKDAAWGKRLQKRLERYRMPATLCNEHGWERRPIKPVFFAPFDIQPGGLSEELQNRLRASRNLIVICSPNSAQSEWVGKEIAFFHSLGRTQNIHFFIVDGVPHSGDPATECFNPVIDKLGLPEILGANIHEKVSHLPWLNRERAYVQLVSKLLNVEFDAIWVRHKRHLTRLVIAWTFASVAILCSILLALRANKPFDVEVRLNEASVHNDYLPSLKNAVVTMYLDNETKTDTIRSLNDCVVFSNIPRGYLQQEVNLRVFCPTFIDIDTTMVLNTNLTIDIRRDEHYYGDVNFYLYNTETETHLVGFSVGLAGQEAVSDSAGRVSFFVPLEQQRTYYLVTSTRPLINDTVVMPTGTNDAVFIK